MRRWRVLEPACYHLLLTETPLPVPPAWWALRTFWWQLRLGCRGAVLPAGTPEQAMFSNAWRGHQ